MHLNEAKLFPKRLRSTLKDVFDTLTEYLCATIGSVNVATWRTSTFYSFPVSFERTLIHSLSNISWYPMSMQESAFRSLGGEIDFFVCSHRCARSGSDWLRNSTITLIARFNFVYLLSREYFPVFRRLWALDIRFDSLNYKSCSFDDKTC